MKLENGILWKWERWDDSWETDFFVLYVFVWPDIWTEETFFDESCIQYVSIDHKCPTFGYIYTTRNIVFPSKLQESTVAN